MPMWSWSGIWEERLTDWDNSSSPRTWYVKCYHLSLFKKWLYVQRGMFAAFPQCKFEMVLVKILCHIHSHWGRHWKSRKKCMPYWILFLLSRIVCHISAGCDCYDKHHLFCCCGLPYSKSLSENLFSKSCFFNFCSFINLVLIGCVYVHVCRGNPLLYRSCCILIHTTVPHRRASPGTRWHTPPPSPHPFLCSTTAS